MKHWTPNSSSKYAVKARLHIHNLHHNYGHNRGGKFKLLQWKNILVPALWHQNMFYNIKLCICRRALRVLLHYQICMLLPIVLVPDVWYQKFFHWSNFEIPATFLPDIWQIDMVMWERPVRRPVRGPCHIAIFSARFMAGLLQWEIYMALTSAMQISHCSKPARNLAKNMAMWHGPEGAVTLPDFSPDFWQVYYYEARIPARIMVGYYIGIW